MPETLLTTSLTASACDVASDAISSIDDAICVVALRADAVISFISLLFLLTFSDVSLAAFTLFLKD